MATLLRACFVNCRRKCLFQIKETSVLSKIKLDYSRSQVTCSHITKRCLNTQESEKPETIPRTVVYKGNLAGFIKSIKLFSLGTSAFGLFGWPAIFIKDDIPLSTSLTLTGVALYSLATPFMIHYFSKRYIKKLEYDAYEDKYIATIFTPFCREKQIQFKLEDVTQLTKTSLFTTVKVKGMPIFFDVYAFDEPEHCKRLLAYDQEIDFKLDNFNEEENESTKEQVKQQNKV